MSPTARASDDAPASDRWTMQSSTRTSRICMRALGAGTEPPTSKTLPNVVSGQTPNVVDEDEEFAEAMFDARLSACDTSSDCACANKYTSQRYAKE